MLMYVRKHLRKHDKKSGHSCLSQAVLAQDTPVVSHVLPTHDHDARLGWAARPEEARGDAADRRVVDSVDLFAHLRHGNFAPVHQDLIVVSDM